MSAPVQDPLFDVYLAYCQFGDKNNAGLLNSKNFLKLMKESGIATKQFNETRIDMIFVVAKGKGSRTVNYRTFVNEALPQVARNRFPTEHKDQGAKAAFDKTVELILKVKAPKATATVPDKVKFHDDRSTYTGSHAHGGPSTIDHKITLSTLLDRSPADSRGRKMH